MHLFAGGVLGDGLGALAPGGLTGQEQTGGGLDLPGSDGATLVVVGKTASLRRDLLKDVVHQGVHYRHHRVEASLWGKSSQPMASYWR